MKDKTLGDNIEIIIEPKVMAEVDIGKGLEKGHFLETSVAIEAIGVQAVVGQDQDQGQV